MELIFWSSVLLIAYAYFGYPVLLYLAHFFVQNRKPPDQIEHLPKVSILISAYNEEKSIENKLVNTVGLDYPPHLLEIIVISDGSTDRTNNIVNAFSESGVLLNHYDGRIGKTECLNRTLPTATGEIIVFSDANALYAEGAIKALVRGFHSKQIGFVSGYTRYTSTGNDDLPSPSGLYTRIESWTKKMEGVVGTCIGADGAIFAIRRTQYQPLMAHDINDFVIPLKIIAQGFRGILAADAFCYESSSRSSDGEFARQSRITNRTLRAIWEHRALLNPVVNPMVSFQLISHKLLKFLVPVFLTAAFLSNVFLAFSTSGWFYGGSLLCQICFYLAALIPKSFARRLGAAKISKICNAFVVVNLAITQGWFKFLRGKIDMTWDPVR